MNLLPKFLYERLSKVEDVPFSKEDCVVIPQDAAQVLNYGGYPQNEIAIINKLQNQQQVEQALSRIKTNISKPSVSAEDATFAALGEVKSRYLQEASEVQDFILQRLDEVGAFVPAEQPLVENEDVPPVESESKSE